MPWRSSLLAARAAMIGADVEVPCVDGRMRRYVNLDYAASTPAMAGVLAAVEEFMPWYSSVHRGSGYKSQPGDRGVRGRARGGRPSSSAPRDGTVVLVRNTTEAINVLVGRAAGGDARAQRPPSSTTPTCCRGAATT